MSRRWVRGLALALAWGLGATSVHAALGYDPFPDAESIKAADELEERLWDEAELLRGQFVRGKPSPAVETMQRLVRGVLMKHWPELSGKVRVFVIDQADVLAFTSPNGDIFISTGMLLRLDSEDELQVVLAREIAHFTHRHTVRTVHAARLGAGAKVIASTALDAADVASKITTGVGVMDLAKTVASMSQDMLVAGGRELLQDRLNKLKETLADNFFRSMSVTGIGMVVKSSIFGYKDSLEEEADLYAMTLLEQKQGSTDAYRRVIQRLYDEAVLDEKKFSVFYANEDRLSDRLKAVAEFESRRSERVAQNSVKEEQGGQTTQSSPDATSPAPVDAVAAEPAKESGQAVKPDVVMELSSTAVVAVVLADGQDGEVTSPTPAQPSNLPPQSSEADSYHRAIEPFVMPVLESELEAGRYGRLTRNIERPRATWRLPERARAVLAEAYVATQVPALQERGQAIAQELLAKHPEDTRMWRLLGNLSVRRGLLAEAKDHLSRALKHAPEGGERGFVEQDLRQIDKKLKEAAK